MALQQPRIVYRADLSAFARGAQVPYLNCLSKLGIQTALSKRSAEKLLMSDGQWKMENEKSI